MYWQNVKGNVLSLLSNYYFKSISKPNLQKVANYHLERLYLKGKFFKSYGVN